MLGEILNAWVEHWGWLWMLVGFTGYIVVVIIKES
jgi:hypothetical protein